MTNTLVDFYDVLGVARNATTDEIKQAYRQRLLRCHPDKAGPENSAIPFNATEVKNAYNTLTTSDLRAEHDKQLREAQESGNTSLRPAQVVSLEEFDQNEAEDQWTSPCRCGGVYRVTEDQLEQDVHLIGCEGCSEVIWVGYEVVVEE